MRAAFLILAPLAAFATWWFARDAAQVYDAVGQGGDTPAPEPLALGESTVTVFSSAMNGTVTPIGVTPAAEPVPGQQPDTAAEPDVIVKVSGAMSGFTASVRKFFKLPAAGQQYGDAIAAAEQKNGIPESLLARLLYEESRFRADIISGAKKSSTGAVGIAQFEPATAAELGFDPTDPHQSIAAAGKYLRQLYNQFGDWSSALAAYNWGQGNLRRKGIASAPAETRNYVNNILSDVSIS